ncbi:NmrA domain-containing protein [Mycena venus]|uniref:NmrA domain-containing protein n=1 Tax=Mycena venus TaxID=2733690 RepID=A0A8H7CM82_9AGAR|nr:NmrA domain-containing protein [Mycena venus]
MSPSKLILVLGATGAQGQAVVDALLAPEEKSGNPSPYRVRALTRDPTSASAQALAARGVECFQGSFTDFEAVAKALEGAYGVWVDTDGFTVGAMQEIYAGMRIYEIAKQIPSLRHYVWSNLPYLFKKSGFNPDYKAHPDAKGRVAEWLSVQPSVVADNALSWTIVTSTTYMDMLKGDGTVTWAGEPAGRSITARETSARALGIASDFVGGDYLAKGRKPAIFKRLSIDEWWAHFDKELINLPLANDAQPEDPSTTTRKENFSSVWRILRDGLFDPEFDMEWIRRVHPGTLTLEEWMRETNYDATDKPVLKNALEGKRNWGFKPELAALL